jgi:glycosyltransferase involved in cell wall biosynthesis
VHWADRVITVSEHSRQEILELVPGLDEKKVVVVYEGPGCLTSYRPQADAIGKVRCRWGLSKDYILYVGLLGGWKNVEGLVAAYALARRRCGIEEELVLCGKTCHATKRIVAEIKRQGLGEEVHLLGFVDDAELPCLYAGARLFVFPSFYEGFGLPPLEAMSYGVPTIVSNTTALAEVAGPGALMVNPHDTTEIADAMVAVTQDPVLADRLRVSGQRRAAEFSWERAAEETLRVVEAAARKSLGRHPPDQPARPGTPALSSSR